MCNTFRSEMGKNIKNIRLQKKITQETVSFETGISRSHIAMIESGKRDVTVCNLFKISRALNVNLREIFAFDEVDKFSFNPDDLYI